jgi:hypothetical protein
MIQVKWKDQEKETYAASKLCFVPVLVLLSVEKGGPVFCKYLTIYPCLSF